MGTYYRNGHGRFFADDGVACMHPFDGDGMISATTFDPVNNRILFRNKYVETKAYVTDKATGTMSQRGIFGTMRSGGLFANIGRTDFKNLANTNVLYANDTLYALWEGGRPHELDPLTLCNRNGPGDSGETNLDGLLSGEKDTFSAHPRYDPKNNVWVNFGVAFDPSSGYSTIRLFEMDATTFQSKKRETSIVSKGPGFFHDFILTDNYIIFNVNETQMNNNKALKALLGLSGFANTIEVNPDADATLIVLIPRSILENDAEGSSVDIDVVEDTRVKAIPVENHFNFHFGNAFEDGNGNVVFDTVRADEIDLDTASDGRPLWDNEDVFDGVYPTKLVRYTLDIENGCVSKSLPPKIIVSHGPEFPSIPKQLSTKESRYMYPVAPHTTNVSTTGKGSGPAGSIMKADAHDPNLNEMYSFQANEFPGEVAFVPKKGKDVSKPEEEDAGYLILQCVVVEGNEKRTDLLIFDVEGRGSLEAGPISRMQLPTFIPHALHGSFVEGLTFEFEI